MRTFHELPQIQWKKPANHNCTLARLQGFLASTFLIITKEQGSNASPLALVRLTDRQTHTHTSAGVDVLRAGRLPDEVVLVEAGAVLSDHH